MAQGDGGKWRGAGIIQRPTALWGFGDFAVQSDRRARPRLRAQLADPRVPST